MAYIIIEVEKTNRRFQLCAEILGKKCVFPSIERDKNGVKYFSDRWQEALTSQKSAKNCQKTHLVF